MNVMTRRQKLLQQLRNNPKNVRFEDLDKLMRWYGFECRSPKGGSHYVYKRKGQCSITVPHNKPIKSTYVREALALIDEYGDEGED
jgi:predicted RNA binding protein YcfA (HicA-like mRNA interferase family)